MTRQALEAEREPEEAGQELTDAGEEPPAAEPDSTAGPTPTPTPADERDVYARRFYLASIFSLGVPVLFFYSLYLFLNAAFGPGTLSARGRRQLLIGSVITGGIFLFACVVWTPLGRSILITLAAAE